MKKAFAATAMIALTLALVGCASFTERSDVKLKATAENNIEVSVQWEVQTAVESKAGAFEGPAPKTVEVGSFVVGLDRGEVHDWETVREQVRAKFLGT